MLALSYSLSLNPAHLFCTEGLSPFPQDCWKPVGSLLISASEQLTLLFYIMEGKKPKQRKYFYPFRPFYTFIPFNKNDHLCMYFLELLEHVPAILRAAHFVQNTAHIFLKIYGQLIKPLFVSNINPVVKTLVRVINNSIIRTTSMNLSHCITLSEHILNLSQL